MDAYYLTFQSMTRAQSAAGRLQQHGVVAGFLRAPKAISDLGCGYAVQVGRTDVQGALFLLKSAGIYPRKIYRITPIGDVEEVFL